MKSRAVELQRSQAPSKDSDCHRLSCCLRVVNEAGAEECLMESVRDDWAMPSATNYCKHPSSRKFVDLIHSKMDLENKEL